MRRVLVISGSVMLIFAVIVVAIVVFSRPRIPPPISAIEDAVPHFAGNDGNAAAPYRFYRARDGALLGYRLYAGPKAHDAVVLLHGSSGTAAVVDRLARALGAAGYVVYAPDLRGHGRSVVGGRVGDVAYVGQIADDVEDLSLSIARTRPSAHRILVGHSSGGSVVLNVARTSPASFEGYLALAPFITPEKPFSRPDEAGWTSVSLPRVIALSILNGFGVTRLNHMDVLAMAVPDDADPSRPRRYTYAMLESLNPPFDWRRALSSIKPSISLLIGDRDQLFDATAYSNLSRSYPALNVEVLRGVDHMGMIYRADALARIIAEVRRLAGRQAGDGITIAAGRRNSAFSYPAGC